MSTQLSLALTGTAAAPSPPQARRRIRAATYESGSMTRRTLGWQAPTVGPNTAVLSTLTTIRARSRQACRNDGYAKGIIEKLVSNIIGVGIKPLSKATDAAFKVAVQALWFRWTDQTDADGVLDLYRQQAQAVRCWLEAGEVFIRLRYRNKGDTAPTGEPLLVPLQIQILEPEMIPHDYNGAAKNGNTISAGIEFDKIGRRVNYYFYKARPGAMDEWNLGELVPIPASSVIHLFDPSRPGQIRGVPHLAAALIKLFELDKFDDATLLRQQIQNLFAAFLTRAASGDAGVNPLTGLADEIFQEGRPVVGMEPGTFQELAPGEAVTFSDPPDAGPNYPSFMKQQLMSISGATGVPYSVSTGDMAGLSDRVMRVILDEFARYVQGFQEHFSFQVCRPLWFAWMEQVFFTDALAIPTSYLKDRSPWNAVKWMTHARKYLHPVQDVAAREASIRAGFTSRSAIVSEQGEDAEVIDQEQAEDNARAKSLGLTYDSDSSTRPQQPGAGA